MDGKPSLGRGLACNVAPCPCSLEDDHGLGAMAGTHQAVSLVLSGLLYGAEGGVPSLPGVSRLCQEHRPS